MQFPNVPYHTAILGHRTGTASFLRNFMRSQKKVIELEIKVWCCPRAEDRAFSRTRHFRGLVSFEVKDNVETLDEVAVPSSES